MELSPLYLIADPSCYAKNGNEDLDVFFDALREALAGGLRLVQYRDKTRARGEMFQIAKQLRQITKKEGAALIINDEIDLAMAVKADGVHLGQDDFPVEMARRLLGKTALIGLSTHNLPQVLKAASEPLNYIGFGPIFETRTKQDHDSTVGISALSAIREKFSGLIYAIGGIQLSHIHAIIAAGASGVAVASALQGASRNTVHQWQEMLNQALSENRAV